MENAFFVQKTLLLREGKQCVHAKLVFIAFQGKIIHNHVTVSSLAALTCQQDVYTLLKTVNLILYRLRRRGEYKFFGLLF